ncbi:MAG: ATP-dependent RecD-like DNA helicase, partial [Chlamydiia bacterium]|nr:ATP-dependent RecD-like DNA helicase [Chlamydiia bacterium]
MTSSEELFGAVESIVFSSEETGFTVARVKQPRQSELTCVVGPMPGLIPGEEIRAKGVWKHHSTYGRQFEVEGYEVSYPADLIGIQKYLESGMVKGIGPVYAERIVKRFGIKTLEVIDQNAYRLLEVEGLGEKRVTKIQECWGEHKSVRGVMIFLRGHGISPAYAQKIYRKYGEEVIEKVKENPYRLAQDIRGIGFKMADKVAEQMGIPRESDNRINAGIEHTLWELSSDGHVCYPKEDLLKIVTAMLELDSALVEKAIPRLASSERIVESDGFVWIKPLYFAELGIARELKRLEAEKCVIRDVDLDKAIDWVQEKLHITLAEEQVEGVKKSLTAKIHILTGGPGTGKSTITRAILTISQKVTNKILLAAPTGRAAKRMSEICYRKAFTIHSLLEVDFTTGGFKRNRDNPLTCDLLIVDEASMIDTQLMYALLKALPDQARLILIGDIDQLPSVGPGTVLQDLIDSETLPVTRLTQIFRQARGSKIIRSAHSINKGFFPNLEYEEKSDFSFIEEEDQQSILQKICFLVEKGLPEKYGYDRISDIQVLAPMKKGMIGTENLNVVLQERLNHSSNPLMRMGRRFHFGDKVMQIRNNYDKKVFNGDVGYIINIDTVDQELTVNFDNEDVTYDFTELDDLVLAYAVSVHKYQGSECPCVVMPIHTSHFKLLYRNLLYTGITR